MQVKQIALEVVEVSLVIICIRLHNQSELWSIDYILYAIFSGLSLAIYKYELIKLLFNVKTLR